MFSIDTFKDRIGVQSILSVIIGTILNVDGDFDNSDGEFTGKQAFKKHGMKSVFQRKSKLRE